MKKSFVFIVAALLVVAFALPASAFESQFGGYWRTRWFWQEDFSGLPDVDGVKRYDTRTRLYYTAKFTDDFSFVNKFEFNTQWGDANGGDIGTDGDTLVIKNSYADFRTGQFRHTVGLQGAVIARGFLFDDDFAGYIARLQPGTTGDLLIPFLWARPVDGQATGGAKDDDVNYYAIYPYFPMGDSMTLNPYLLYAHFNSNVTVPDTDWWWLGVDFDMKTDSFSLWASGIYSGGQTANIDHKGYLLAAGVDFNLGVAGLWVDFLYSTGQGAGATDIEAFVNPPGASYYWAEIMGLGIFDNTSPNNTPGNQISNLIALGVGANWNFGDKLKLKTDLWYAMTAEDVVGATGVLDDKLGIELDLILTYAMLENLNLDLVFAYLSAGDAVGSEDPMEAGVRMSFSF